MNIITIFLLVLLTISIFNNILMFVKYNARDMYPSDIDETYEKMSIDIYYKKEYDEKKCSLASSNKINKKINDILISLNSEFKENIKIIKL